MRSYTSRSTQRGKGVCHYWEHFTPNAQEEDFPPRFSSEGHHAALSTGNETSSSLNSPQDREEGDGLQGKGLWTSRGKRCGMVNWGRGKKGNTFKMVEKGRRCMVPCRVQAPLQGSWIQGLFITALKLETQISKKGLLNQKKPLPS